MTNVNSLNVFINYDVIVAREFNILYILDANIQSKKKKETTSEKKKERAKFSLSLNLPHERDENLS